jgi:Arc/MetJ-type ribon-helix-helix transcriptional regulator
MSGKSTSVHLSDEMVTAIEQDGRSLSELIRAGLKIPHCAGDRLVHLLAEQGYIITRGKTGEGS